MLFTSVQYLFFFIAILIVSWLLSPLPKLRLWTILLASFYFYFSNNGWVILLLFACMQIDFIAARLIEKTDSPVKRKLLLLFSMGSNLGMLAFFKYFNFFCGSCSDLAHIMGMQANAWQNWNIVLPVGISFYTFESMSYTIDVYRGSIKAERSWHRFALFVAYFPHLIAGPILRPHQFLPQLDKRPKITAEQLESGLFTIAQGLFKKIVLADFLANYADQAFSHPTVIDPISAWIGIFAFTFQIYYDFSGYTDVAIGCGRLMGFELPLNFNRPYASASITEFWKRWHISLSTWLRDYLYIPLGGSRMRTSMGVYRNLMLTMLLGGLWHGAAWHFVLWGILQGAFLVFERIFKFDTDSEKAGLAWLSLLSRQSITFMLVTFSWMVFRTENMGLMGQLVQSLFNWNRACSITNGMLCAVLIMVAGLGMQLWDKDRFQNLFIGLPVQVKGLAYAGLSIMILACTSEIAKPFIYFQF